MLGASARDKNLEHANSPPRLLGISDEPTKVTDSTGHSYPYSRNTRYFFCTSFSRIAPHTPPDQPLASQTAGSVSP